MTKTYSRPTKTKGAALGWRPRSSWVRLLRRQAYHLLSEREVRQAESEIAAKACAGRRQDKAAWMSIRVRFDHVAIIDVLQKRHLEVTGKEISRSEVLAALMMAGLRGIAFHDDFSFAPRHAATNQPH